MSLSMPSSVSAAAAAYAAAASAGAPSFSPASAPDRSAVSAPVRVVLLGCGDCERVFAGSDSFRVLARSDNGADGILLVREHRPDLVVLDLVLAGCDGFRVLETVRKELPQTRLLVLSYVSQPAFVERAIEAGADYYLVRPVPDEDLLRRALDTALPADCAAPAGSNALRLLDEKISNIFLSVGIPAHIKGFRFLRDAVKVAIFHHDAIGNITKFLYPQVALHFGTSASKVERAIRHAIEVAWNRGRIDTINTIFGVKAYTGSEKPTNGEFIALVADKMMLEIA